MNRWVWALVLLAMIVPARGADVTVDCTKKFQVIEGFGTCLTYWDGQAHQVYATDRFKDLYVNDLGCWIIRLDLRPSLEANQDLDTANLNLDKLNWDDAGFRATLDTAASMVKMKPGQIKVIASVWSPPAWMKTNNDTAHGGNLRDDRREQFGKYLAAACLGLQKKFGIALYGVSIQNELSFAQPFQSCVYNAQQFHDTVKAVGEAFKKWNVKTRIMGPEDMGFWPDREMGFINACMDDPATRDLLQVFCVHNYKDDGVSSDGGNAPKAHELRDKFRPLKREMWMTEASGEAPVWENKPWGAMGLGWMIHNALANGDASAYVYWQMTHGPAAHKGGEALMIGDEITPKYYAAKHFFKFIRPGARRVETTPTNKDLLAVSAFEQETDGSLTIVLINSGDKPVTANLTVKQSPATRFQTYRSTAQETCKLVGSTALADGKLSLEMPGLSMVTLAGGRARP